MATKTKSKKKEFDPEEMSLGKALAIIRQAREDEIDEEPMPSEEKAVIEKGDEIFELALAAWDSGTQGEEVKAILSIDANWDEEQEESSLETWDDGAEADAEEEESDDEDEEDEEGEEEEEEDNEDEDDEDEEDEEDEEESKDYSEMEQDELADLCEERDIEIDGRKTKKKMIAALEEADAGDGEDEEPDEEEDDEDEELAPPFDGYDKMKISEILTSFEEDWDEEQIEYVQAYEAANKNRGKIVNWEASTDEEDEDESEEPEEPEEEEGDAEGEETEDGDSGDDDADEKSSRKASGKSGKGSRSSKKASGKAGQDSEYEELIEGVKEKRDEERLSPPPELPEDRIEMPIDIRKKSDSEIQHLHSAMNAYAARSTYSLALEEAMESACGHVIDKKVRQFMLSADKMDPDTNKAKTVTQLEAEAHEEEEIAIWTTRKRGHKVKADDLRRQRDIYLGNVAVLSRQHQMRTDERAKDGGGTKKPSRRSK